MVRVIGAPYLSQSKGHPAPRNSEKALFTDRIDGQTAPESSMRAMCLALRQTGGFIEEGPTDGYGSWKSPDTGNGHVETSCGRARGNPRDVKEAGRNRTRRFRRQHRQALEEGRAYPHRRPRYPSSAQACRAYGPQPGNGRSDPDQGEQESRLPRVEGIERVGLNVFQAGPSGEIGGRLGTRWRSSPAAFASEKPRSLICCLPSWPCRLRWHVPLIVALEPTRSAARQAADRGHN